MLVSLAQFDCLKHEFEQKFASYDIESAESNGLVGLITVSSVEKKYWQAKEW